MPSLPGLAATNRAVRAALGVALCGFVLAEVNYPHLAPQAQLALFALFGVALLYLAQPAHRRLATVRAARWGDVALAVLAVLVFGYVFVQSEPLLSRWWIGGQPLGNRAGLERGLDHAVGLAGLLLVLEGTRRAIGWTLPLLTALFVGYALWGAHLPDWLFPHRGYAWSRVVAQTFLQSQGVFGVALNVMFTYVFAFVLFGMLLEQTGATGFIIQFAQRMFRGSVGGPAKVAVVSSGMMGSLSGSAVANAATTGTFTIPMMRSNGFSATAAAGIEASASAGGALMPPVMGAGAYMMLELVHPPVTYLQIIRAALLPAVLYYVSLLIVVHLQARREGAVGAPPDAAAPRLERMQGVVFFGAFAVLIAMLLQGFSAFRAVSVACAVIVGLSVFSRATRVSLRGWGAALGRAAEAGYPLIVASCCVGVILGVVTLTGVGARLPAVLLPLAENSLFLALVLIMISTIVLGMGLPSAVCYLLMATLIGPVLGNLGVEPLAAHLFIFYFGMMSMVTPPVALAAYTTAAIARADIFAASWAAFRFSLVGFVLPFAFVVRPELLLLTGTESWPGVLQLVETLALTLAGVGVLAAGVTGFSFARLAAWERLVLVCAAVGFIAVDPRMAILWHTVAGLAAGVVLVRAWRRGRARMD